MQITKQMYQLAKKIVEQYEEKPKEVVVLKPIEERKEQFMEELRFYLNCYNKEMLREFYNYWTEHGSKDRKFRKEKEKSFNLQLRLKTWDKRSKQFNQGNNLSQKVKKVSAGELLRQKHNIPNGK